MRYSIRKRAERWSLAAAAAGLLAAPAAAQVKPATADIAPQEIEVRAVPIPRFAGEGRAPARLDGLAWRGGLVLSSPSPYFGGWSGLALDPDGEGFVAVSDSGVWMTGRLAYEDGRVRGIAAARLGPLRTRKDGPLSRQRDRDAEAIALARGTMQKGTAFVAFEQNDRIGVFALDADGLGKPERYLAMPRAAGRLSLDGVEALAVLAGGPMKGALVAFAENPPRGEAAHRGWIWIGGEARGFTVPGLGGFSITDAASLDDGSVLLLERRFRWLEGLRVRLRRLAADGIRPGGAATGAVLLEADQSHEIDNLEALAVSRSAAGETVVTLLSDDNFNRLLQRTVLLQFTLKAGSGPEAETARKE